MRYVKLGNTGIKISCIGLGCSKFGSALGGIDGQETERLIRSAVDGGINFFDTANIYGQGESERLLGKALSLSRKDMVISTKAGQRFSTAARTAAIFKKPLSRLALHFPPFAREIQRRRSQPLPRCFEAEYLEREVEQSLKRLGTDYIDIFYLHSPQPEHLNDRSIESLMLSLKKSGKIRAWGISCDANDDIGSILSMSSPEVVQLPYFKTLDTTTRDRCEDIRRSGGSVIARGVVSQMQKDTDRSKEKSSELNSAWCAVLQSTYVTAALCGTTSRQHLDENLAAVNSQTDNSLQFLPK